MKERELALQNLNLAYAKYREIIRNLEEGHKVDSHSVDAADYSFNMDSFTMT